MSSSEGQNQASAHSIDSSADSHDRIDFAEILRRIPHRYPFLLIDRAEDWVKNKSITGIKNVTFNEPFFTGHFPENPVMPGVLLIEALGQTGAVLMSKSLDVDPKGKTIFFASVENARFRAPVRPGDVVHMYVEVLKHRGGLFKFTGKAKVLDKIVCEVDFSAMLVEDR